MCNPCLDIVLPIQNGGAGLKVTRVIMMRWEFLNVCTNFVPIHSQIISQDNL